MPGDNGREFGEGGSNNGAQLVSFVGPAGGQEVDVSKTTRQLIMERVSASEDERGVTLSSLQRGIDRNSGVVRQQVERLVRDGVLVEERTTEEFGETRWLRKA